MEQMTTHIGIEPGRGLVGRFGDTVILIPRGEAEAGPDEAARELLDLAAAVASDRQVPASTIAARLAAWVIGRLSADALAFGIVVPVRDGVVMFLRGAVWCTVTEGGSTRELSGEQALTWVDQIVPGTFEQLAIGSAAGRPVRADPLSDLRDGVVPGQGFVLTRAESVLVRNRPRPRPRAPQAGTSHVRGRERLRSGTCTPSPRGPTIEEPADARAAAATIQNPPTPGPRAATIQNPPTPGPRAATIQDARAGAESTSRPPAPGPGPAGSSGQAWGTARQVSPGGSAPGRGSGPPADHAGADRPARRGAPDLGPSRSPTARRPRCRPLARRWRRSRRWAC